MVAEDGIHTSSCLGFGRAPSCTPLPSVPFLSPLSACISHNGDSVNGTMLVNGEGSDLLGRWWRGSPSWSCCRARRRFAGRGGIVPISPGDFASSCCDRWLALHQSAKGVKSCPVHPICSAVSIMPNLVANWLRHRTLDLLRGSGRSVVDRSCGRESSKRRFPVCWWNGRGWLVRWRIKVTGNLLTHPAGRRAAVVLGIFNVVILERERKGVGRGEECLRRLSVERWCR